MAAKASRQRRSTKGTGGGASTDRQREDILSLSLQLADEHGWDALQLREVAERLGSSTAAIRAVYRDKDAIANAWFDTAVHEMLKPTPEDFLDWPVRERLEMLLARWFDTLARHRRASLGMLGAKLYPAHLHHWVPMVFDLSRLINWLRDAAGLDAGGRRRQIEEIWLTTVFLAVLAVWGRDDSPDQGRTRAFMRVRLRRFEAILGALGGRGRR